MYHEPCACGAPAPADPGFHPGGRCGGCRNADRRARWAALTPEQKRAAGHKAHGRPLTPAEWDAKVAEQDGRCAICGERPPDRPAGRSGTMISGLTYDHDHEDGRGRGLLCQPCNTMIGHAQDDPERLVAAAAYLRGYQAVTSDKEFYVKLTTW